jgi:thioredoxin 1
MNNIITVTKENFDEVISNNELVLLDFWAEWCEPCHAFSKICEQVAPQNPDVIFGKINSEEQIELAHEFNVRSIPMILLLRRKIALFSEAGLLPATALQDLINQAKALDMDAVLKTLQEGK